ncbi:TPA: hypothetical protein ACIJYS_003079 [Pseudomonas aeruginosa]
MGTRRSILEDETIDKMDDTLRQVLTEVAAGRISVSKALTGISHLIHAIDAGEQSEIKTWVECADGYRSGHPAN